jgi:hypothetical protein
MKYFAEGRTTPAAPSGGHPSFRRGICHPDNLYFAKEDSLNARDRLQAPGVAGAAGAGVGLGRRHRAHKRRVSEAPA